jgi:hypothetical protein
MGRKTKHEITGRGEVPIRPGMKPKEITSLREQQRLGLTSVPGAVRGLATRPLQTVKGAWRHAGPLGKVMAVGDIALGAPRVLDPTTAEGTAEKALGTLGTAGGYLLGGRMGLLPSVALGSGMGYLGGKAGKLFGGKKSKKKDEAVSEQVPGRPTSVLARRQLTEAVPEVGRLVGPG